MPLCESFQITDEMLSAPIALDWVGYNVTDNQGEVWSQEKKPQDSAAIYFHPPTSEIKPKGCNLQETLFVIQSDCGSSLILCLKKHLEQVLVQKYVHNFLTVLQRQFLEATNFVRNRRHWEMLKIICRVDSSASWWPALRWFKSRIRCSLFKMLQSVISPVLFQSLWIV